MKTAMQELISRIKENYDNLSAEGKNFASVFFLTVAPMYEAIEEQQLIDAFNEGSDRIIPIEGQQYYNQTYNNENNTTTTTAEG